jgi:hypothetical protein
VLIERNVFFNIPRAGITFNDGFGGNNTVFQNVLFNTVMETLDNGPFNVWDRQKWFQDPVVNPTNYPFSVYNNYLIGNVNGAKGIDLDDGVTNFQVSNNTLIYSSQKFKGDNVVVFNNFIFPLMYGCVFMTPISLQPASMSYQGNTCVSSNLPPYFFNADNYDSSLLCRTQNFLASKNQWIGSGATRAFNGCGAGWLNWAAWTKQFNQDLGSTLQSTNPTPLLEAQMVLAKVLMTFPEPW